MPRKPATSPAKKSPPRTARAPKAPPPQKSGQPILERADIRRILFELATTVAPADVATLMGHEAQLRVKAANITDPHLLLFRNQLDLAMDCLRDHVDERCPQIPYFTISQLGAALLYFADELDAIPDFLPHLGNLDDAVVMAMACELGADGLRRYCDWSGRDLSLALPNQRPRRSARLGG